MTLIYDPDLTHWDAVKGWLGEACTYGDGWWSIEKVHNLLLDGRAALWVLMPGSTPVAGVVTAIAEEDDGRKVAEVVMAGGSGVIGHIGPELPTIEAWARAHGAAELLLRGRRGWARVTRGHGWEEIAVTMRKEL